MITILNPSPHSSAQVIIIPDDAVEVFKQLVQRGAQTWADAPADIKEFADLITTGKILQNYRS
jgi:hypothetical protein